MRPGSKLGNRTWMTVLSLMALLMGCVKAGEIPYVAPPEEIEVLPDTATDWVDTSGGLTDGWRLRIPAGAVKEAVYLRLSPLTATQTPLGAQGWQLAVPAVVLTPIEIAFEKPAELIVPIKPSPKKLQVLYAPDVTHIAAETWEFTEAITMPGEIRITLPLSTSIWPVVALTTIPPLAVTEPVVCIDPFVEKDIDAAMELPEAEGECATDDDCMLSGCQDEVCAPKIRATICQPPPRICGGGCGCISGVCRWLQ